MNVDDPSDKHGSDSSGRNKSQKKDKKGKKGKDGFSSPLPKTSLLSEDTPQSVTFPEDNDPFSWEEFFSIAYICELSTEDRRKFFQSCPSEVLLNIRKTFAKDFPGELEVSLRCLRPPSW